MWPVAASTQPLSNDPSRRANERGSNCAVVGVCELPELALFDGVQVVEADVADVALLLWLLPVRKGCHQAPAPSHRNHGVDVTVVPARAGLWIVWPAVIVE